MPTQDLAGILQELSTLSAFLQRNADPGNIDTLTSGNRMSPSSSGWHDNTLLKHNGIEAATSPRPDKNVHSTSTEDRVAHINACMELLREASRSAKPRGGIRKRQLQHSSRARPHLRLA